MTLRVVPMGVREAQRFLQQHHSHHDAPRGGRFAVAVADEAEGGGVLSASRWWAAPSRG